MEAQQSKPVGGSASFSALPTLPFSSLPPPARNSIGRLAFGKFFNICGINELSIVTFSSLLNGPDGARPFPPPTARRPRK